MPPRAHERAILWPGSQLHLCSETLSLMVLSWIPDAESTFWARVTMTCAWKVMPLLLNSKPNPKMNQRTLLNSLSTAWLESESGQASVAHVARQTKSYRHIELLKAAGILSSCLPLPSSSNRNGSTRKHGKMANGERHKKQQRGDRQIWLLNFNKAYVWGIRTFRHRIQISGIRHAINITLMYSQPCGSKSSSVRDKEGGTASDHLCL